MEALTPLGNQVNPNAGFDSYSKILGMQKAQLDLQGARQNLQTQQYQQQSAQANALQDQRKAQEMQTAAILLQDPVKNGLTDEEGNPTANAYSIIQQHLPITGTEHFKNLIAAAGAKVQLAQGKLNLSTDRQKTVFGRIAGLATTPNTKSTDVIEALDDLENQYAGTPNEKGIKLVGSSIRTAIAQHSKEHPDDTNGMSNNVRTLLTSMASTGQSGAEVAARNTGTPASINRGGLGTQFGITAPAAFGGGFTPTGEPIAQRGVAPTVVNGPDGSVHVIGGSNGSPDQGEQPPTSQPSGQPNPQRPQPSSRELPSLNKPNWNDSAGNETYLSQMKNSGEHYRSLTSPQGGVYDPANGTMPQRYRNDEIIRAINSGISTGSGSDSLNNFVSMLPKSFQTKSSNNYQIVGSFLADKIGANLANMGLSKTIAGQTISESGGGSLKNSPEALKEIVKVSDATNTARQMYMDGLNIITKNGQDMGKVPAFKAAWQRNFDINIFRHMDAVRRGDHSEEEAAQSSRLSPTQLKQLAIKAKNLNSLSTQGLLAQ